MTGNAALLSAYPKTPNEGHTTTCSILSLTLNVCVETPKVPEPPLLCSLRHTETARGWKSQKLHLEECSALTKSVREMGCIEDRRGDGAEQRIKDTRETVVRIEKCTISQPRRVTP